MRISDWSSDVCSSDLLLHLIVDPGSSSLWFWAARSFCFQPTPSSGAPISCERRARATWSLRRLCCCCRLRGILILLCRWPLLRSEEHTSELQSLMRISYAVFCFKKKTNIHQYITTTNTNTE